MNGFPSSRFCNLVAQHPEQHTIHECKRHLVRAKARGGEVGGQLTVGTLLAAAGRGVRWEQGAGAPGGAPGGAARWRLLQNRTRISFTMFLFGKRVCSKVLFQDKL